MITVIGGSNIDYIGNSFDKIIYKDSNIGKVKISFGGVARNITENLIRLGVNVNFITAIGDDVLGQQMKKELEDLGVNVITPKVSNVNSSSYLAICDETGDMINAVCDNSIIDYITKDFVDANNDIIEASDYLVIETNISKEMVEYIVNKYQHKKIICDGISTMKVLRVKDVSNKLFILKVNKDEFKSLGVFNRPENLIVSCGGDPVLHYHDDAIDGYEIAKKDIIVGATGAGDSFVAGLTYGLSVNKSIEEAIKLAIKASSITIDCVNAVNPDIVKIKDM